MKQGGLIALLTIMAAFAVTLLCVTEPAQANTISDKELESLKSQFLPPEFRNVNLTTDDLKKAFQEKCTKTSNIDVEALSKEIEEAALNASIALAPFSNVTALNEEIRIAKPTGELDTVFHNYCSKVPAVERSLRELNAKFLPCLNEEEKQQNTVMLRVGSSLLDFACSQGGNRLALFVAEKGTECVSAHMKGIQGCVNSSFADYMPKNVSEADMFSLPELLAASPNCDDVERFELCTLHYIKQCADITPANVVESVFKFVNKGINCTIHFKDDAAELAKSSRNGASVTTASVSYTLHAFVTLLVGFALRQRTVVDFIGQK